MQQTPRVGQSAAWLSIAGAAVLALLHWIPFRPTPSATYLLIVGLLVPAALAAAWSGITEGVNRALCGAGAAIATLGWLIWGAPIGTPMLAYELLGEGFNGVVRGGEVMMGLGLGLALTGVALSREGKAALWVWGGAGLAVVTPLLSFAVSPGTFVFKIVASLQVAAVALPAVGVLLDRETPARPIDGDWNTARAGAKTVGGVMVAFFVMGLIVNRLPADEGDGFAAIVALGQTVASLVLLLIAAGGLGRLAKAPHESVRAIASFGRVGAWAAAGSAVLTLGAFGLAIGRVVKGLSPEEVQFALPTLQAAGWVIAVVSTALATSRIAKADGDSGLAGLGIATAVMFFLGSGMLAAAGVTGLRAFDSGEPSLAALGGGALLSLVSIVMFLRLVNKVAERATPAAPASPGFTAQPGYGAPVLQPGQAYPGHAQQTGHLARPGYPQQPGQAVQR